MKEIIIEILGGLGLFLGGMTLMRRGIEKVAGNKLREMFEKFSKTKFLGLIGGLFFSAIMQSSSACTSMVVDFVDSGLMSLSEATGLILGANIGTTITAFLVSLHLSVMAPAIVLIGAAIIYFIEKTIFRQSGEIIFGFGLLFLGCGTISSGMAALEEIPGVVTAISSFDDPLLCILLGTVATILLKSSSVTVSLLVIMGARGLIDLDICMYIILGCNLGSCSSALFSAADSSKNAKSAAFIHLLINLFGTIFIGICIFLFGNHIETLVRLISGQGTDPITIGRSIAVTHFIFKVFQVVALYPFTGLLSKMTNKFVPSDSAEDDNMEFHLEFIDPHSLPNPTIAILSAVQEMERMAYIAKDNLNMAFECLMLRDEIKIEQVYDTEKYINFLNRSLNDYLTKINQNTLPLGDAKMISAYFHVINDIERIGDHAKDFVEMVPSFNGDELDFNEENLVELNEMMDLVNRLLKESIRIFVTGNTEHLQEVESLESQIDLMDKNLEAKQIRRVSKGTCSPQSAIYFSDVLSGLEQVADLAMNIAFALTNANAEE